MWSEPSGSIDAETLELIEELNFKNWMHYNKEIVEVLYNKPMTSEQLHEGKRRRRISTLTRALNMGIIFGVLTRYRRKSNYFLTEKARKYYEEHIMEKAL